MYLLEKQRQDHYYSNSIFAFVEYVSSNVISAKISQPSSIKLFIHFIKHPQRPGGELSNSVQRVINSKEEEEFYFSRPSPPPVRVPFPNEDLLIERIVQIFRVVTNSYILKPIASKQFSRSSSNRMDESNDLVVEC